MNTERMTVTDPRMQQAIAELQAVMGRLEACGADHLLSTSLFRRRGATWVANDA